MSSPADIFKRDLPDTSEDAPLCLGNIQKDTDHTFQGAIILKGFSYLQLRYMARFESDFHEAQQYNHLGAFWPAFYLAWFDRFPINSDGNLCSVALVDYCLAETRVVSIQERFYPSPCLELMRLSHHSSCCEPDFWN